MRRALPILAALLAAALAALPARGAYPAYIQATAKLKLTSAQAVTNNTTFTILFGSGTELWKSNVTHSTVSNTGRLTVVTPGKYDVIGYIDFASNSTSDRRISIQHNNSADVFVSAYYNAYPAVAGSLNSSMTLHGIFNAVAGDYFFMPCSQFSGGNLNANAGTSLSCTWIGTP